MIKRLAHRNANVQLYTLEVRLDGQGGALRMLILRNSWQMRYHRIVEIRCIESLRQGALRMLCCDLQMTGCAKIMGKQVSPENTF